MSLISHLIEDYQKPRVEFQKILLGIKSERHRWSQCVDWTNKKLSMAVGALFIRDNFNPESKVRGVSDAIHRMNKGAQFKNQDFSVFIFLYWQESALEMIHSIREAFNDLLNENAWMDDETRAVAKDKANAMNERIGYPDILTNSTELEKEYEHVRSLKNLNSCSDLTILFRFSS